MLTPLRDRFLPWLCEAHVERRGEAKREERSARQTHNALVRALPYRLEAFSGCAREEDQVYEATRQKMRGVLAFRHGWASACIRCGAKLT